jgi:hypothetical protein
MKSRQAPRQRKGLAFSNQWQREKGKDGSVLPKAQGFFPCMTFWQNEKSVVFLWLPSGSPSKICLGHDQVQILAVLSDFKEGARFAECALRINKYLFSIFYLAP